MKPTLEIVLDGLMSRYRQRVEDVSSIIDAMLEKGMISSDSDIENDHIAFRTLGVKNLGIASLEKIFLHLGYKKEDSYNFPQKKLNAYWYSPANHNDPRIFISELRVSELSETSREIIEAVTSSIKSDPVDALDLNSGEEIDQFLHSPLWQAPTIEKYNILAAESEYAAWVMYNRYYLNHFTISVHNLPEPHCKLETFNEFVKSLNIKLNSSGSEIKTSKDGLLRQSSTVSKLIKAEFLDENKQKITQELSGSYVEFAERGILPQFSTLASTDIKREHRREGFEASNADKIFESTYSSQTLTKK